VDILGLAASEWFFSLFSLQIVKKIFVSLISAFNILLHTIHTHLLKLEVHIIFQHQLLERGTTQVKKNKIDF